MSPYRHIAKWVSKNLSAIASIVFFIIAIVVLFSTQQSAHEGVKKNSSGAQEERIVTRVPVPSNTTVPSVGEKGLPKNIAVPSLAIAAAPMSEHMLRKFSLTAQDGKFTPDTFIAAIGDIIHIDVKAVDGDYDFIQPDYGLTTNIEQGETRVVEFSPLTEGKVTFSCTLCGKMRDLAKGYIIVTKGRRAN